jgi:hypothetical protein
MRHLLRRFPAVLPLLLVFAVATPGSAQKPQTREGFWIGFGFGYGGLDITCDGCEVDRESGVSGYLKLGGSLSQNVLLGVQTLGWYKDIEGVDFSQGSLTGNIWWYPSATGGFWLTGGAGLSRLEVDAGPLGSESESGFAALGGLGYDIRVGRNISIVPSGTWQFGFYDGGGANVLQLALGITFH